MALNFPFKKTSSDLLVKKEKPDPDHDFYIPIGSLMNVLKYNPNHHEQTFPYIEVDTDQISKNGINKQVNILLKRRNKFIQLKVIPTDITNLENN